MRLPFYQILPDAYLFPSKVTRSEIRSNHEEPVRQWCAHELLRAYGVPVGQIEFEREVRVGSKRYRIDVLISKDGNPWAVIECKEPSYSRHEGGIDQARSYANAHEINAEFIIYTNGDVWHVQRRRGNEWVHVPDLPKWQAIPSEETIVPLLEAIQLLKPLLRQLDHDVVGKHAIEFLGAMQELFNGMNLITRGGEPALVNALDNLLRGICDPSLHVSYRCGKLNASYRFFEEFRSEAGLNVSLPPIVTDKEIGSEIHALHVGVNQLLDIAKEVPGESSLLLRLGSSLLAYGMRFEGSKTGELKILPEIHGALRDYLNHVLILQLNVCLPDAIDLISVRDMRDHSEKSSEAVGCISFFEVRRELWKRVRSWLRCGS